MPIEIRGTSFIALNPENIHMADAIAGAVTRQAETRAVRAREELIKAARQVLSGPAGSRPGSPPGMRTGAFRASFKPKSQVSVTRSDTGITISISVSAESGKAKLGTMLERGTSKMAARPYMRRITQKAGPSVQHIINEPYHI